MNPEDLLAYLKRHHKGHAKAISSRRLEIRFCVAGSTLRRAVLQLRLRGHPAPQGALSCHVAAIHLVCRGQTGYYYAATPEELDETIRQFTGRLCHNARLRSALGKTAAAFSGTQQTTLLGGKGEDAH